MTLSNLFVFVIVKVKLISISIIQKQVEKNVSIFV